MKRILLAGGAGFIGSAFARAMIAQGHDVLCLDALTGDGRENIAELEDHPNFRFIHGDIRNREGLTALFAAYQPDWVVNLAAERSGGSGGAEAAIGTNFHGASILMEEALAYWHTADSPDSFRFLQTSTSQVFGARPEDAPPADENTPYRPQTPYAASKAAADHMAQALFHSHGLPVLIALPGHGFGPRQQAGRLIPSIIDRAQKGTPLPLGDNGGEWRDWMHVTDQASALYAILQQGSPGSAYVIGARTPIRNSDLAMRICDLLDSRLEPPAAGPRRGLCTPASGSAGTNRGYALDPSRLETELGWRPARAFEEALEETVDWYLALNAAE